jgi:hypothetical protein
LGNVRGLLMLTLLFLAAILDNIHHTAFRFYPCQ